MATISTKGIVRKGHIELVRDIGVPDGTTVSLTIRPVPPKRQEWERRVDALCGACANDPTFADAVAQAVGDRKRTVSSREIDFDAPS